MPHREHSCVSTIKTNQLKLFKEIIAPYSGNHMKHITTFHGQMQSLDVKTGGIYSNHHA
jgi:hypothetical protein